MSILPLSVRFRQRIGTAAQWANSTRGLLKGELAVVEQPDAPPVIKVGDGRTPVSDLPSIGGGLSESEVQSLIDAAVVPDAAWTQVDAPLADVFTGEPVELGPDGFSFIRWTRVGRTVFARWFWMFDGTGDVPSLPALSFSATDLPVPQMPPPGLGVPGGYGYVTAQPHVDEDEQTVPGFTFPAPPAIVDLTGAGDPANAALAMVTGADEVVFGFEPLLTGTSPQDWTGRAIGYQGAIAYEAAEAAP